MNVWRLYQDQAIPGHAEHTQTPAPRSRVEIQQILRVHDHRLFQQMLDAVEIERAKFRQPVPTTSASEPSLRAYALSQ